MYRVCQKVIPFWYPSFLTLLDATIFAIFVYLHIFIKCLISEPSVVSTDGLSIRMEHHHTLQKTVNYLKRENVSFIEPQMWPPNSPDLNPVDYAVWGALQQQV